MKKGKGSEIIFFGNVFVMKCLRSRKRKNASLLTTHTYVHANLDDAIERSLRVYQPYVHTYVQACMHTHTFTLTAQDKHSCMYTYMCIYIYLSIYMCFYMHLYLHLLYKPFIPVKIICARIYARVYINYLCVYAFERRPRVYCKHTYMHTYLRVRIYVLF